MCAVFRPSQDGESENPRLLHAATGALIGRALFFGSVSFGLSKRNELGLQAESPGSCLSGFWISHSSKQQLPPEGGSRSLMGSKKVTRERPFPDQSSRGAVQQRGDFSTRHPGSIGKRRTSMCGALRVYDLRGPSRSPGRSSPLQERSGFRELPCEGPGSRCFLVSSSALSSWLGFSLALAWL